MPWRECSVMEERLRFVARLLEGESMTEICREFGISRKNRAQGTPLSAAAVPNDLWCTDFKGEFKLGNGRYCYPLTVSDHASRYLLLCEALESTREDPVIESATCANLCT